jgi:hypothetical protein
VEEIRHQLSIALLVERDVAPSIRVTVGEVDALLADEEALFTSGGTVPRDAARAAAERELRRRRLQTAVDELAAELRASGVVELAPWL